MWFKGVKDFVSQYKRCGVYNVCQQVVRFKFHVDVTQLILASRESELAVKVLLLAQHPTPTPNSKIHHVQSASIVFMESTICINRSNQTHNNSDVIRDQACHSWKLLITSHPPVQGGDLFILLINKPKAEK